MNRDSNGGSNSDKWWQSDPNPGSYLTALAVGVALAFLASIWVIMEVGGGTAAAVAFVALVGGGLGTLTGRTLSPTASFAATAVPVGLLAAVVASMGGEYTVVERVALPITAGLFFGACAALIGWGVLRRSSRT